MKKILLLAVFSLVLFASAQSPVQQDPKYVLMLTAQELNVILKGLGKLSIEEASATNNTVLIQVMEQQKAWQAAAEKKAKDTTKPKK